MGWFYQCEDEVKIHKDGHRESVPGAVVEVPFPSVVAQQLEQFVNQHERPALPWLVALLQGDQPLATRLSMRGGFADYYHRVVHFCRRILPSDSWGSKQKVEAWLARRPVIKLGGPDG